MGRMDWSKPEAGDFEPGIYLAEVKKCSEKTSKKGIQYLNPEWHVVEEPLGGGPTLLCWDVLMLGGAGRGISQAKLKVLGFDEGEGIINAEDLVGRRAWLTVDWQEFNGQKNLKVVTSFDPEFRSGYTHENQPPPGATPSTLAQSEDDTPF